MAEQQIIQHCVNVIHEECNRSGIPIARIILFGSRSRGDAQKDSDWDFLVIIGKDLEFPAKAAVSARIQTRLAVRMISADIIIKSENVLARERDDTGCLSYYALREGIYV